MGMGSGEDGMGDMGVQKGKMNVVVSEEVSEEVKQRGVGKLNLNPPTKSPNPLWFRVPYACTQTCA